MNPTRNWKFTRFIQSKQGRPPRKPERGPYAVVDKRCDETTLLLKTYNSVNVTLSLFHRIQTIVLSKYDSVTFSPNLDPSTQEILFCHFFTEFRPQYSVNTTLSFFHRFWTIVLSTQKIRLCHFFTKFGPQQSGNTTLSLFHQIQTLVSTQERFVIQWKTG